jgi:hypothetical protein
MNKKKFLSIFGLLRPFVLVHPPDPGGTASSLTHRDGRQGAPL